MIDIHSHILPGLDDGAADLKAALKMAKIAVKDGVTIMIATPHCYDGVYNCKKDGILAACREFNKELQQASINLQVYPGAEIRLTPEIVDLCQKGQILTMGNRGDAILLELPDRFIPEAVVKVIKQLIAMGMHIIVAHPERNSTIHLHPDVITQLVYEGATIQLTAGSLVGKFGRPIKLFSETLVKENKVHYLATDCHNVKLRAPKFLSKAIMRFNSLSGAEFAYESVLEKSIFFNSKSAVQAGCK